MTRSRRRSLGAVLATVAAALSGVLLVPTGAGTAATVLSAASAPDSWILDGHGWGHGRGMGQYGAYGYATLHGWDYRAILQHFYGGTHLAANAGDPAVRVALVSLNGRDTIVQGTDLRVTNWATGADVYAGTTALRVVRTSAGVMQVYSGPGCAGPWTAYPTAWTTPQVTLSSDSGTPIMVCKDSGNASYRGQLLAFDTGSRQATINYTTLQDYLRGVVPRESPASWADAKGGAGLNALYAQAVAARSYALANKYSSYADTCDTTACQVYGGAGANDPRTDKAVHDTLGQVMRTASGAVALTEFSSSTGGWTAGGTFPPVVDEGDVTSPNHNWSVTLSSGQVNESLGVGAVASLSVTRRNGLGADGGRVLAVSGTTVGGSSFTLTGNQVRQRLGLKSDWFTVTSRTSGACSTIPCTSFVTALYQDFMSRSPDAAGLAYWVSALDARRASTAAVAASFSRSPEYVGQRIDEIYQTALGRSIDPQGREYYIGRVNAAVPFSAVVASVVSSPEAVHHLGQGDIDTWVRALYPLLLGREPDEAGAVYWAGQVEVRGRDVVAQELFLSQESRRARAAKLYEHFLGRPADFGGLSYYSTQLFGWGEFDVPAELSSSPEYLDRSATRFP